METKEHHLKYQAVFNEYIKSIQLLLSSYSLREVSIKFPMIEWKHIRLASEMLSMNIPLNINIYCLYELRQMEKDEQKKWIRFIRRHNCSPKQLRKHIRESRKINKDVTLKSNKLVKREWLRRLREKMNGVMPYKKELL
jgi:hypothetical protein